MEESQVAKTKNWIGLALALISIMGAYAMGVIKWHDIDNNTTKISNIQKDMKTIQANMNNSNIVRTGMGKDLEQIRRDISEIKVNLDKQDDRWEKLLPLLVNPK